MVSSSCLTHLIPLASLIFSCQKARSRAALPSFENLWMQEHTISEQSQVAGWAGNGHSLNVCCAGQLIACGWPDGADDLHFQSSLPSCDGHRLDLQVICCSSWSHALMWHEGRLCFSFLEAPVATWQKDQKSVCHGLIALLQKAQT